jgi:copper resistance protein C
MIFSGKIRAGAVAVLLLALAGPAVARVALAAAVPAAGAKATAVRQISLTFGEPVTDKHPEIAITMTAMPGMSNHPPMKVSGFIIKPSADGKSLTAVLPRQLPAGTYKIDWKVGASGANAANGSYSFSVR